MQNKSIKLNNFNIVITRVYMILKILKYQTFFFKMQTYFKYSSALITVVDFYFFINVSVCLIHFLIEIISLFLMFSHMIIILSTSYFCVVLEFLKWRQYSNKPNFLDTASITSVSHSIFILRFYLEEHKPGKALKTSL